MMNGIISQSLSRAIRSCGHALDFIGKRFEVNPYTEKLIPCTKVVKIGGIVPSINKAFVASSATVAGKVTVGKNTAIWYGAILRGDVSSITVGENVSIGDRCMVHCTGQPKELPTSIGDGAVVEAGVILHGCTLAPSCLVQTGAQVMDGAVINSGAIVRAGSVVLPGTVVPANQIWAGVPAAYVGECTEADTARIKELATENASLAMVHAREGAKAWQEIEKDEYDFEQATRRSDYYYQRLSPEQLSERLGEFENHQVPGRVLDSPVSGRVLKDYRI